MPFILRTIYKGTMLKDKAERHWLLIGHGLHVKTLMSLAAAALGEWLCVCQPAHNLPSLIKFAFRRRLVSRRDHFRKFNERSSCFNVFMKRAYAFSACCNDFIWTHIDTEAASLVTMEFLKRWTRKPHHSPPASTSDSEKALEAWKRKFGELQIRLARSDPAPFVPGRRLGGGGAGIVYETQLGGVALALKRTYAQKLSKRILNEIAILGQLSGKRHEHIVQLIGSYIHPQRSGYEIGVLISPVAHCDLACFMLMMDILKSGVQQPCRPGKTESSDETESAAEILSVFWIDNPNPGQTRTSAPDSEALHKSVFVRASCVLLARCNSSIETRSDTRISSHRRSCCLRTDFG
jgi:hypothetical protein